MTPLSNIQCLHMLNTDQTYRAWLSCQPPQTERERNRCLSLEARLKEHAALNQAVGLGEMPKLLADRLRKIEQSRPGAVITSPHALYAYAALTAVHLENVTTLHEAPIFFEKKARPGRPVVVVDKEGLALLMRVPAPEIFIAQAEPAVARLVLQLINDHPFLSGLNADVYPEHSMKSDYIAMIATHLNAPYGLVVQETTVKAALQSGTFKQLQCSPLELELLQTLFVECAPSLIGRACYQIGADLENAHRLYLELLQKGHPIVFKWQDAMRDVVA